jgi:dienelactone hydrolase
MFAGRLGVICAAMMLGNAAVAELEFWTGTAERAGASLQIIVRLDKGAREPTGSIGFPDYHLFGLPLREQREDGDRAALGFGIDTSVYLFEGRKRDSEFTGELTFVGRDATAPFTLRRVDDPLSYTTEDVTFTNDDVSLAGTVFTPRTPGPHPAIVLMHGSGDNVRWQREGHADFFARQGLIVLSFDKRGCGESTGNWRLVGFEPLARDGLAGIKLLQSRPDVDPRNVGFWGISQAGWIMPLAASLAPGDVAFIVTTSGATVNVEEEGKFDYIVHLRDAGYPAEDIAKAERNLDLDHDVTMTGEGYDELRELVKAAREEAWWKDFNFQLTPVGARRFPKLIGGFDPRPILEAIDTPVLWMYGLEDKSVEPSRSIAILNEIMAANPKPWTIKTFSDANHGIIVPRDPNAAFPMSQYAPGHWETIAEWLREHVLAGT